MKRTLLALAPLMALQPPDVPSPSRPSLPGLPRPGGPAPTPGAGLPGAGLLGTGSSLLGSDFCQRYACERTQPGEARPEGGVTTAYALNVPGLRAEVVNVSRRPDNNLRPRLWRPIAGAVLRVDVTNERARTEAGKVARDFVRTLSGAARPAELFDFCVHKAREGGVPANAEDLIVLEERAAVKCVYTEPGRELLFTVFPPNPPLGR